MCALVTGVQTCALPISDGQLKAEIWSWSRARGLFAGVALDGAVLSIDDEANQAVYGAGTTPRMIFEDRAANAPSTAIVNFRDELEEATAAARAARGTGTASQAVATQPATTGPRSEEHTSELQSLMRISYAVFCLKTKTNTDIIHN